jgi:hypothetical protein
MGRLMDLTGQRFGRLVALEIVGKDRHGKIVWLCKCDCGNYHKTTTEQLRKGITTSCGCYHREIVAELGRKGKKHGLLDSHLDIYRVWTGIKTRCNNPNSKDYKNYGGRGIKVCSEWENDPAAFAEWALSHGYKKGLQIDRIDNDKGYSPDNCQFITCAENVRKKPNTVVLTVNGLTMTAYQWGIYLGHDKNYIRRKYNSYGRTYVIGMITKILKSKEELLCP